MTNNLKKSLFVGLAALSFVSVASATNASAKSYAKVTSNNTLTTDPTTRNFESTGSNALMTKAGTVKGAKTVASKATMKSLMNSKSSKNYFRAYREATTNRGTKYYKVVSMDGKYRGWIYVGGVKSANTTTEASISDSVKYSKFYLKDATKNTLWDAPKYTQYKASKVNAASVDFSKGFKVDKAETKTREGSLYYHVTSLSNSNFSGWVYAGQGTAATSSSAEDFGGLTTTLPNNTNATENNSVKVNFVDTYGNTVGSAYTFVSQLSSNTNSDDTSSYNYYQSKGNKITNVAANQTTYYNSQNRTQGDYFYNIVSDAAKSQGYNVDSSSLSSKRDSAVFGGTVNVTVKNAVKSNVGFRTIDGQYKGTSELSPNMIASDYSVSSSVMSKLAGNSGDYLVNNGSGALVDFLNEKPTNLQTMYGRTQYSDGNVKTADGKTLSYGTAYHVEYTLDSEATKSFNKDVKVGNTAQLLYNTKVVEGAYSSNSSNSSSNVNPTTGK